VTVQDCDELGSRRCPVDQTCNVREAAANCETWKVWTLVTANVRGPYLPTNVTDALRPALQDEADHAETCQASCVCTVVRIGPCAVS